MLTKQIIQKCSWWRNIPPSPLLEWGNSIFFIHFLLLFILLLASIDLSMMFETVFLDLLFFFFSSYPLPSIWWYYGWALHSVSWLYKSNNKLKFGFFFSVPLTVSLKVTFFPPHLPPTPTASLYLQHFMLTRIFTFMLYFYPNQVFSDLLDWPEILFEFSC